MKTTAFSAQQMAVAAHDAHDRVTVVTVPTLSAFAIEHAEFKPPPHVDFGHRLLYLGSDFTTEADSVVFTTGLSLFLDSFERSQFVVHYHGIRDYGLLFPQVTEFALRERLGRFYEEAESNFDHGAWLSFALMAGAVYEGLLGQRLGAPDKRFADMIRTALDEGILTPIEARILHVARDGRNLVHAARFNEPCVTRADAMDMRIVMDTLIRKFANVTRG